MENAIFGKDFNLGMTNFLFHVFTHVNQFWKNHWIWTLKMDFELPILVQYSVFLL
jgi:hypothetical protein